MGGILDSVGHRKKIHKIAPTTGKERGDLEHNLLRHLKNIGHEDFYTKTGFLCENIGHEDFYTDRSVLGEVVP